MHSACTPRQHEGSAVDCSRPPPTPGPPTPSHLVPAAAPDQQVVQLHALQALAAGPGMCGEGGTARCQAGAHHHPDQSPGCPVPSSTAHHPSAPSGFSLSALLVPLLPRVCPPQPLLQLLLPHAQALHPWLHPRARGGRRGGPHRPRRLRVQKLVAQRARHQVWRERGEGGAMVGGSQQGGVEGVKRTGRGEQTCWSQKPAAAANGPSVQQGLLLIAAHSQPA